MMNTKLMSDMIRLSRPDQPRVTFVLFFALFKKIIYITIIITRKFINKTKRLNHI